MPVPHDSMGYRHEVTLLYCCILCEEARNKDTYYCSNFRNKSCSILFTRLKLLSCFSERNLCCYNGRGCAKTGNVAYNGLVRPGKRVPDYEIVPIGFEGNIAACYSAEFQKRARRGLEASLTAFDPLPKP